MYINIRVHRKKYIVLGQLIKTFRRKNNFLNIKKTNSSNIPDNQSKKMSFFSGNLSLIKSRVEGPVNLEKLDKASCVFRKDTVQQIYFCDLFCIVIL